MSSEHENEDLPILSPLSEGHIPIIKIKPRPIPDAVKEKIINRFTKERNSYVTKPDGSLDRDEKTGSLMTWAQLYATSGTYLADKNELSSMGKFDIAYEIISSGLLEDPRYLVDSFISVKDREDGTVIPPEVLLAKDRLQVLLVEKGFVKEGSKEEKDARDAFARLALDDDEMKQLMTVLPIGFAGAIARLRYYRDINDPKERERMRAFTTKSLMREYMGNFKYYRGKGGDLNFRKLVDLLPAEVFSEYDEIAFNLAKHYCLNEVLKFFIDSEDEGFDRLDDLISSEQNEAKRNFFGGIRDEFKEVRKIQIPPQFKTEILDESDWKPMGSPDTVPFPAFRQKYFLYEFLKRPKLLLNGDTGATKTACSYLAMESLPSEKITIFGPARARDTWPEQASKHFKDGEVPDVFAVEHLTDLKNPRIDSAKYVYVSGDLLGRNSGSDSLRNIIQRLVVDRGTDGIVLDEAHVFRHNKNNQTKALIELISAAQLQYKSKLGTAKDLPMLALTATPIFSSLKDLDVMMALLYPGEFALPGEETVTKHTFYSKVDKDENVAFIKLYGEKLMMQWTVEDIFGGKVPNFDFDDIERVSIPMTPTQKILYDWVVELEDIDWMGKHWPMQDVLLLPNLVKKRNQEKGWYKSTKTVDQLGLEMQGYYEAWKKWRQDKNPRLENIAFCADWIALYGNEDTSRDFLLDCFFHKELFNGTDTLAEKIDCREWSIPLAPSSKFEQVRQTVREHFILQADGSYKSSRMLAFISPHRREGIATRYLLDAEPTEEDLVEGDWNSDELSLYELILTAEGWLPRISRDLAVNIDSTKGFPLRRKLARAFREEGDSTNLMVAVLTAIHESIDMAPRGIESMDSIDGLDIHCLGWPWEWSPVKQVGGRFKRPGLGKPIRFFVYENEGSYDEGNYKHVRRKYLTTQITLAGIAPDKEDKELLDAGKVMKRIVEIRDSDSQYQIRKALRELRGMGESNLKESLTGMQNGKLKSQLWAEFYYNEGSDEFRVVGNNAEFVGKIFIGQGCDKILSIGAGSCLLDRKLKAAGFTGEIVNLDINGQVLKLAKEKHPEIGQILEGLASKIDLPDSSVTGLDCSFVLDMTRLFDDMKLGTFGPVEQIERVKILGEMNRILAVGGTAVLTFPEGVMDQETFENFTNAMTSNFGFEVVEPFNGMSFSSDTKPKKRLGWVLTLKKTGQVRLENLNPNNLFLLSDDRWATSRYKEKADPKGGVLIIQDPHFVAHDFEVIDPASNQISGTTSSGKRSIEIDPWLKRREQFIGMIEDKNSDRWDLKDEIRSIRTELREKEGYDTDFWRKTVRGVEDILSRGYSSSVISRLDLTSWEQAEMVTTELLLDPEVYRLGRLPEPEDIQRMLVRRLKPRYQQAS